MSLGLNSSTGANPITDNLDLWSSATKKKATVGRGKNGKISPHGINKLRELILELAVRGKLVPQDPNDEAASVLLEKIAEKKARLVEEGKVKKQITFSDIPANEHPFHAPPGWEFVRLGNLATRIGSGSTPRGGKNAYVDSGIPFLRSQNVWNHGLQLDGVAFITEETHDKMANTVVLENDILLNITGASLGRCAIYPGGTGEANVSQHVSIIRPVIAEANEYLHFCILSPYVQKLVWERQVGMAREGLSKKVLELFEMPIPPLAEQHRIVAKVDELMALCDQLEQQQTDSLHAHQTLVRVFLDRMVDNANTRQPIHTELIAAFDTLFTTEEAIDQLKQTILQLAVMGKLVPQNPNDEPANLLLEKIAAEKQQLIKDKKIKKQKPLPPISNEEKPFELPEGWEWCRFSCLSNEVATGPFGSMIHKADYVDNGVPLINPSHMIDSKIVEDTSISVTDLKAKELSSYKLYVNDIVMARRGEMGRCALVTKREENWLCGTGSFALRFNSILSRRYILLLFKTQWVQTYLGGESVGTTMTNLNHGILNKLPLLLPPVAEQHRIVAKVNELMALCDTLKDRLNEAQITQAQLADAVVEQAVG